MKRFIFVSLFFTSLFSFAGEKKVPSEIDVCFFHGSHGLSTRVSTLLTVGELKEILRKECRFNLVDSNKLAFVLSFFKKSSDGKVLELREAYEDDNEKVFKRGSFSRRFLRWDKKNKVLKSVFELVEICERPFR